MKTQNPSSLDGLQLNQICKQCAQNSAKEQIVSIYYAKEESRSSLGGPYSETVTINYKDISVKSVSIMEPNYFCGLHLLA